MLRDGKSAGREGLGFVGQWRDDREQRDGGHCDEEGALQEVGSEVV